MRTKRSLLALAAAAVLMALVPAPSASAHVHLITPLRCTPAPANAGGNQTNETPAAAANGGPISGVIPVAMGGNVQFREPDFFGVCDTGD
ncbi:MAG: hypothetical protein ACRDVZ_17715 [Jiangellaceae bacterium]